MAFETWEATKDPDEVKDYGLNWADRLAEAEDTLSSSAWSVVTGGVALVLSSPSFEATGKTTIWVAGGTLGVTYELLNRVVTSGGRTYDKTMRLKMKAS